MISVKALFAHYKTWVPLLAVTTGLSLLIYVCGQQILRQGANDPQIQLAEDGAADINNGKAMELVVGNERVDFGKSLAPFKIVYGSGGGPMLASGVLNGRIPDVPFGVLAFAKDHGVNRLTWQPQQGVRVAAVVIPFKSASVEGYLLVGRSLREIENREDQLLKLVLLGWVGILVLTALKIIFLGGIDFLLRK